jgi:DNA-binding beta-propeller fold protein YncE
VAPDGSLVVADSVNVVRVAPDTGDRTVLSGCTAFDRETASCTASIIGTGPSLGVLQGIDVEPDGSLVVAGEGFDAGLGAVVRVAPDTGNRTVLSSCAAFDFEMYSCTASIGNGPPLLRPEVIAREPLGSLVVGDVATEPDGSFAVGDGLAAVVRVASDTGDRTVLSGCAAFNPETYSCTASIGNGPPLGYPEGIAVEPDGSLVVVDSGNVVRVDPDTGDRTVIGTGPPLDFPEGIAVEPDGSLVVVDSGNVVRVNPVTGERALVSGFDRETNMTIGNGPLLVLPRDIAVEANGSLIVVDTSLVAVVRVNPLTGNRTLISR